MAVSFLSWGTTPHRTDTINTLLKRIAGSDGGGGGGETGNGSPEGVVTAEAGTTYFDAVGSIFWVKGSGSGNTGWIQLVG